MKLTLKEQDIISRIAEGKQPKEIVYELGLKRNTFDARLKRVKQKLEAKTTAHAAVLFIVIRQGEHHGR